MGKNAIPEPFIGIFPENIWERTPLLKKRNQRNLLLLEAGALLKSME